MSLAIAIETPEGIVLAADSRATFGDPRGMTAVNDTVQKISCPSTRTAVAMVGMAETGAALLQHITAGLASQPGANVDVAAETLRMVGTQYFAQWFGPPKFIVGPAGPVPSPRPDVLFMLVGYNAAGQPKIISQASSPLFNFAPNLSTTGFGTVGVVPLAVYLLNRLYKRGLGLAIAKDLAVYCILETACQDGKVGGPIRVAVVKPNTDTVILGEDEISAIEERTEQHRESLKNSFLNLAQE